MDKIKNNHQKLKITWWAAGCYFVLSAFLILAFASRSSMLYPCNDWNDANSYFSVGKGIFNGKVPYRDIFDQKGMYLYFFYGLAYLISHTTFRGVFLLELVLAAADLAGISRILQLYVKRGMSYVLTPLVLSAAFSSRSFYWGGSAEEMCLPFLIWGLYLSLRYFKKEYPQKTMGLGTVFAAGVLAGMTANIKFTVLGFFFAWMMCVAFSFLVKKDFTGAVRACFVFLGGMAVTFIPWVIYFAVNHALYYWYWGYVYINVFAYSNLNGEGPGLAERIYVLAKQFYWVILSNLGYFVFVISGVIYVFAGKCEDGKHRLLPMFHIFALCFFLFLGIYVGGSDLPYYALPLSVFTVLGFALIGKCGERLLEKAKVKVNGKAAAAAGCVLTLCISSGFIFATSMNTPYMQVKREDHFLYKLKKTVEQVENPTLLNIGCLDAGLYTVCDIVPTCQWFQTQTVIMDTVLSEQERYIREGQVDFVLARDYYPDVIWEQYELAAEEKWQQDDMEFTYYLFRRKGGI